MKKYFFLLIVLLSVVLPHYTWAGVGIQDTRNLTTVQGKTGIGEKDLGKVLGQVINVALSLVGIIFLLLMVYGGYLWLTSRGDEGQIEKSKEIIKSAIIGLVLVMSAYAITVLVTARFK